MAQTRKNIIILSVLYLLSRLVFLTRYPIFNDEAIYLREAWVMVIRAPHNLWYSLSDTGKQPLLFWVYGLVWRVIGDPLLAGRLVSVFIGLTTLWAVYLLGGLTAGILLITAPLFVFFDRLALVDSALAAIFAWILVLLVRLQKKNAIRTAVLTGLLAGLSLWIKSIGFLFMLVTALEFVYIWYRRRARSIAIALPVFIGIAGYTGLPLFLRPEAERIFSTAHLYTYSFTQLVALNFKSVGSNIVQAFLDYAAYVSPLVVLAFCVSMTSAATWKKRILIIAWLVVFAVTVFFGKSMHARYVLFTAIPVLILSSFVLSAHKIILGITVFFMTILSTILITDPPAFFHMFPGTPLRFESFQYVDGWPSGYGVKDALAAIDRDRHGEPAVITVRWDSGNPEDAVFVYTAGQSGLTVKYFDPRLPEEARDVLNDSARGRVYFVTRQGQYNGFERYLVPLSQFSKPGGREKVELFRVRL